MLHCAANIGLCRHPQGGVEETVMHNPQIPPFGQARVLVAGDVMLDRYWHGPTGRI